MTIGSPEESVWREQNPDGWHVMQTQHFELGVSEAHRMVAKQDYNELYRLLEMHEDYVEAKDRNGYTPLHDAARMNSAAIVELLVERGADVNAMNFNAQTVLNVAKSVHKDPDHPVIRLLESLGAKDYGPQLSESCDA